MLASKTQTADVTSSAAAATLTASIEAGADAENLVGGANSSDQNSSSMNAMRERKTETFSDGTPCDCCDPLNWGCSDSFMQHIWESFRRLTHRNLSNSSPDSLASEGDDDVLITSRGLEGAAVAALDVALQTYVSNQGSPAKLGDDDPVAAGIFFPDTIVYSRSALTQWYFTSRVDSSLRRKRRVKVTPQNIFNAFTKKTSPNLTRKCPIVAQLIHISDASPEALQASEGSDVVYLTKESLYSFLFELKVPFYGTLQRFVLPSVANEARNTTYRVVCSPHYESVERAENTIRLFDARVSLQEKARTFDGATVASTTLQRITDSKSAQRMLQIARGLSKRLDVGVMKDIGVHLRYLELLMKIDTRGRFCLMWCRSMRGVLLNSPCDRLISSTCMQCHKNVDMSLRLWRGNRSEEETRYSEEKQDDHFWAELVSRFGSECKLVPSTLGGSTSSAFLSPLASKQLKLLKSIATTKFGRTLQEERKLNVLAQRSRRRRQRLGTLRDIKSPCFSSVTSSRNTTNKLETGTQLHRGSRQPGPPVNRSLSRAEPVRKPPTTKLRPLSARLNSSSARCYSRRAKRCTTARSKRTTGPLEQEDEDDLDEDSEQLLIESFYNAYMREKTSVNAADAASFQANDGTRAAKNTADPEHKI